MDSLKQYQPLLGNAKTASEVAGRATQVKDWIKSIDDSRSDSNKTEGIVDHFQFGMGYKVQADVVDLGNGGFEINRMLLRKDAKPLASHAQVTNGQIDGFEVSEFPDGTKQGYTFVGSADGKGPISTSLLDGQDAQIAWSKVFIKTIPLAPLNK